MSRKAHYDGAVAKVSAYAKKRLLEFDLYSPYHMRLRDGGFTTFDCWTSGRYYILGTNYLELVGKGTIERGGEKGWLPKHNLEQWLDKVFFPESLEETPMVQ